MDDTTRALLDRAELDEVLNRYAGAIDLRDWARLGTVFADSEIAGSPPAPSSGCPPRGR